MKKALVVLILLILFAGCTSIINEDAILTEEDALITEQEISKNIIEVHGNLTSVAADV
jgi:hypothetical protein